MVYKPRRWVIIIIKKHTPCILTRKIFTYEKLNPREDSVSNYRKKKTVVFDQLTVITYKYCLIVKCILRRYSSLKIRFFFYYTKRTKIGFFFFNRYSIVIGRRFFWKKKTTWYYVTFWAITKRRLNTIHLSENRIRTDYVRVVRYIFYYRIGYIRFSCGNTRLSVLFFYDWFLFFVFFLNSKNYQTTQHLL